MQKVLTYVQRILSYLKEGNNLSGACRNAGIARKTLANWIEKFPALGDLIDETKAVRNSKVEATLYRKAVSGDAGAIRMWLEAHEKDKYGQEALKHDGTIVQGITINMHSEEDTQKQKDRNTYIQDLEKEESQLVDNARREVIDIDAVSKPLRDIDTVVEEIRKKVEENGEED